MNSVRTTRDLINHLKYLNDKKSNVLNFIYKYDLLISALEELDSLIEMKEVKDTIIRQVKTLIMNAYREKNNKRFESNTLHTIILGTPGVGKSKTAHILARIWDGLGVIEEMRSRHNLEHDDSNKNEIASSAAEINILSKDIKSTISDIKKTYVPSSEDSLKNISTIVSGGKEDRKITYLNDLMEKNKDKWKNLSDKLEKLNKETISLIKTCEPNSDEDFSKVSESRVCVLRRENLIGEYQGHTGPKCHKILGENKGKVIIIDECYNLCHDEKDNYGMEVLTIIMDDMDRDNGRIYIFVGYEELIQKTILAVQPGLLRRFKSKFVNKGYTFAGLSKIFLQQLSKEGLSLDPNVDIEKFFKQNMEKFKFFGGDTKNLTEKCEYEYCTHYFDLMIGNNNVEILPIVTENMLRCAFEAYEENRLTDESISPRYGHMYM